MRVIRDVAPFLLLALVACEDSPAGLPDPIPLPPLDAGYWQLHTTNGKALPAPVHERQVDGRTEHVFVDSMHIAITSAGRWNQSTFLESWSMNERVLSMPHFDQGSWTATERGYLFRSDVHGDRFVLRSSPVDYLSIPLRIDGIEQSFDAVLRRTSPPPALPGN